ncbi:MAG: NUDIX domain-containing protein [Spirochaetes bacterium]|nr:NUDIX domain-containing protein [Spirochaetota bacterium]
MANEFDNIRIRVGALIFEEGRALLISHQKENQVYWLIPGGGVNFGETLPEALKREILEELGIEIEVQDIVLVCESIEPEGRRHILNIGFYCKRKSASIQLGNDERLHGYRFFLPHEILQLQLFPNINEDLVKLLLGETSKVYRAKSWIPL